MGEAEFDWYYAIEGRPNGPVRRDELAALLFAEAIGPNTLVWREGMPQWVGLEDEPTLRNLLRPLKPLAVPPPLPPPQAPRRPVDIGTESDAPEITIDETPSVSDKSMAPTASPFAEGSPWSRFFARVIDVVLWELVLIILVSFLLPLLSPELAVRWVTQVDERVNYIVLLPIAMVINGIVMGVFGNSLGKTIFGLKVVPANDRERYGVAQFVARELRVWFGGMAMGIPFANLITWWNAYQQVSSGKQPYYDARRVHVRQSAGELRIVVGVLCGFLAVGALVAWNVYAANDREILLAPQAWKNPETGLTATIPAGWYPEVVTADDGSVLQAFTSVSGVTVMLGSEEVTDAFPTLVDYSKAIAANLNRAGTDLRLFTTSNDPVGLRTDGQVADGNRPITVFVVKTSTHFWRLFLVDTGRTGVGGVEAPALTSALWRTVGRPLR